MKQPQMLWAAVVLAGLFAAGPAAAAPEADARFQAGKSGEIRLANVSCQAAGDGVAAVRFDLAWEDSWRAAWAVEEGAHGGQGTLKLENWDAAWIFVKFRKPGTDTFLPATLATAAGEHQVPAGAALEVGLSDDGKRGVGVFVYRAAPGAGKAAWNGVTLRWRHDADGLPKLGPVTIGGGGVPAAQPKPKARTPEDGETADDLLGEFDKAAQAKAGAQVKDMTELRVFAVGMVYVPECAFYVGDGTANDVAGQFTAGATGQPVCIAGEGALTLGGTSPAGIGNHEGVFTADDFSSARTVTLPAGFPKGFAAFYCLKRELTRAQLAHYLNTFGADQRAGFGKAEIVTGNNLSLEGAGAQTRVVAAEPEQPCPGLNFADGLGYAAWAGLRPLTELEYEKACRGPLKPVPDEYAWGTSTDAATAGARGAARASYWGILGLSGGVIDLTVSIGHPLGRRLAADHGDGSAQRPAAWAGLEYGAKGRGGSGDQPGYRLRVSDREELCPPQRPVSSVRLARSAAAGKAPSERYDDRQLASRWFNDLVRLTNLKTVKRDPGAVAISFDIAWDEAWRDGKNHDAAWVFFKSRAPGGKDWKPVLLSADKVLNPSGYGQGGGTKLEFVVAPGEEPASGQPGGATGVFLRRAEAGRGPLTATGVTVLAAADVANGDLQALAIEMVYVPEGPFYLGSGGSEGNRFYQYTDGSQHTQPYRVTGPGAIPTGPQTGRLWSTGAGLDPGDAGELPAAFPKGYRAFYCMKYPIRKGQFAAFLTLQSEVIGLLHVGRPGIGAAYTQIGAPDGAALTWHQGSGFGAWAGLRPLTELEYEKACRGPDRPLPNDSGESFWGIRELQHGFVFSRVVSTLTPQARAFAGTHGRGTTERPADWPPANGEGTIWRGNPEALVPFSARVHAGADSQLDLAYNRLPGWSATGWRGARTDPAAPPPPAPTAQTAFRLELKPPPDLGLAEVSAFYLTGQLHNGSDKPLTAELLSPLPEACFPDGPAVRTFTAAAQTATPFKMLAVVTRQTARTARQGQLLPIQIKGPDGAIVAEATARLSLADPAQELAPPVVQGFAGGPVAWRVTNGTDRALSLTFELQPPPDVKLDEPRKTIELAAAAGLNVTFPVPAQPVASPGFRPLPYRVSAGQAAPQDGTLIVEFRVQSRWWVGRSQLPSKSAPAEAGAEPAGDLPGELFEDVAKAAAKDAVAAAWKVPPELFKNDKPPAQWTPVVHGASLWLSRIRRPTKDTVVLGATRVLSPAARDVLVKVASESPGWTWLDETLVASKDWGLGPGTQPFIGRIFLNGEALYDSRPEAKDRRQPARLTAGANTLLVQCLANAEGENLANVFVLFYDPQTGRRYRDLSFDIEKR